MSDKKLRECFGLFATGVMVATANLEGELYGMTINSFASVSLNPPLLLFSVANSSFNLEAFTKSKSFILNVLSTKQLDLAKEFARSQNHKKWEIEKYHSTKLGNIVFENSLGYFECKKHQIIAAGDHHVIIGEIIDFAKLQQHDPLLYFSSQFC